MNKLFQLIFRTRKEGDAGQEVAKEIHAVNDAAESTGNSIKNLHTAKGLLNATSRLTSTLLGQASGAARQLAQGLNAAALAARTLGKSALGALVHAIQAVIAIISILYARFKSTREAIDDTGDAAEAAAGKTQTLADRMAEASRQSMAQAREELQQYNKALKEALDSISLLLRRQIELNDAELGLKLAEIDANADMSPAEKEMAATAAKRAAGDRRAAAEDAASKARVDEASAQILELNRLIAEAEAAAREAQAEVDRIGSMVGGDMSDDQVGQAITDAEAQLKEAQRRQKQAHFIGNNPREVHEVRQQATMEINSLAMWLKQLNDRAQNPLGDAQVRAAEAGARRDEIVPSARAEAARARAILEEERHNRQVRDIRRQETGIRTETTRRGAEEKRAAEIEAERQRAAAEEETRRKAAEAARAAATPEQLASGHKRGVTVDESRTGPAHHGVGRATADRGRELVDKAFAVAQDTTRSDAEVAALLEQIIAQFESIGAAFQGRDAQMAQFRADLDRINSQFKYNGVR